MLNVHGLHHVTAIAGPAQENLDFYVGILGMRLVKKSVNQDDPGTYHLFYADADGHPGTDLTFFPWSQMAPGREGHGLSTEVSLAVPPGSLGFWESRLKERAVRFEPREERFGEKVLPLTDPHGLRLALVESANAMQRPFTAWNASVIPADYQIRGLESARLNEVSLTTTTEFLQHAMGFRHIGTDNGWARYGVAEGKSGEYVDVREIANARRGVWGTGAIHHLAWRVDDAAHQEAVRHQVEASGAHPTPMIDRFWFKSVYFREPGGVLFELATDGPGFAVDEDAARLGETLVLPPWLEQNRPEIEAAVPRLVMPTVR